MGSKGRNGNHKPPAWERAVAVVGLALVVALIGYIVHELVTASATPPNVTVQADGVSTNGNDWLVTFTAKNSGDETAASVVIRGELVAAGRTVETSHVTLGYVPGKSARRGGLFFQHNPEKYTLKLRALGYAQP